MTAYAWSWDDYEACAAEARNAEAARPSDAAPAVPDDGATPADRPEFRRARDLRGMGLSVSHVLLAIPSLTDAELARLHRA